MNNATMAGLADFSHKVEKTKGRVLNACDAYEYSMLTSPETVVYIERVNGETKSFKASAPKAFTSKEDIQEHLKAQLQAFRKFRVEELGHQPTDFLDTEEHTITDAQLEHYCQYALCMEARKGKTAYVQQYLDMGIAVDAPIDDSGLTPLHSACTGTLETIQLLIDELKRKEGDLNQLIDPSGESPLHKASEVERADVAHLLIEQGMHVDHQNNDGETALYTACRDGKVSVVGALLAHKADANLVNHDDLSPLHIACFSGHMDIATLLIGHMLSEGVDPNQPNRDGVTLLHVACMEGQTEIFTLLMDAMHQQGRDVDQEELLHIACQHRQKDIVGLLLQNPTLNINKPADNGVTPLYTACQKGDVEIVEMLLNKEADIRGGLYDTFTPLMVASLCGHKEVVELLLDRIEQSENPAAYLLQTPSSRSAHEFARKKGLDIPEAHLQLFGKTAEDMAQTQGIATRIHTCLARQSNQELLQVAAEKRQEGDLKSALTAAIAVDPLKEPNNPIWGRVHITERAQQRELLAIAIDERGEHQLRFLRQLLH